MTGAGTPGRLNRWFAKINIAEVIRKVFIHNRLCHSTFTAALLSGFLATTAGAQQSTRFPNGQAIPLADIGVSVEADGSKIYYDLQTEEIIRVERPDGGTRLSNAAPIEEQPVERVPLGEAATKPQSGTPRDTVEDIITVPETETPSMETEPLTQSAALPRAENPAEGTTEKPDIAKLQVLLDRLGMSPGVIDGRNGSNVKKALASLQNKAGRDLTNLTPQALDDELMSSGGAAFVDYAIKPEDVDGPFVEAIPVDYAKKAELPAMSYTSALEALAERFHMDEDYLRKLNPGVDFARAGTTIRVANPGGVINTKVTRIEADKAAEQVRAYDETGKLVVAYPATIGSADTPSPSGTVEVARIAIDPNYTYNPKINFTQGENTSILTIPPGPNGPVGSVWIALSKPTYGIHGTPEPARIGKTNSHGCVRLTNWDAKELAKMVSKGTTVEFLD